MQNRLTTRKSPKSKPRLVSPRPDETPVLAKAAVNRVVELLREQDKIIGGLTDYHVKWLLMFTYKFFSTRKADMVFDFESVPKRIYITPRRQNGEKLEHIGKLEWPRWVIMLKSKKVSKDLPGFLGIDFEIKFCRVAPAGAQRIEAPGGKQEN